MTRLTDERIAEIEAKLASYGFKDSLGHPLTNCKDFQDLLTEVKALKAELSEERSINEYHPSHLTINQQNSIRTVCAMLVQMPIEIESLKIEKQELVARLTQAEAEKVLENN